MESDMSSLECFLEPRDSLKGFMDSIDEVLQSIVPCSSIHNLDTSITASASKKNRVEHTSSWKSSGGVGIVVPHHDKYHVESFHLQRKSDPDIGRCSSFLNPIDSGPRLSQSVVLNPTESDFNLLPPDNEECSIKPLRLQKKSKAIQHPIHIGSDLPLPHNEECFIKPLNLRVKASNPSHSLKLDSDVGSSKNVVVSSSNASPFDFPIDLDSITVSSLDDDECSIEPLRPRKEKRHPSEELDCNSASPHYTGSKKADSLFDSCSISSDSLYMLSDEEQCRLIYARQHARGELWWQCSDEDDEGSHAERNDASDYFDMDTEGWLDYTNHPCFYPEAVEYFELDQKTGNFCNPFGSSSPSNSISSSTIGHLESSVLLFPGFRSCASWTSSCDPRSGKADFDDDACHTREAIWELNGSMKHDTGIATYKKEETVVAKEARFLELTPTSEQAKITPLPPPPIMTGEHKRQVVMEVTEAPDRVDTLEPPYPVPSDLSRARVIKRCAGVLQRTRRSLLKIFPKRVSINGRIRRLAHHGLYLVQ